MTSWPSWINHCLLKEPGCHLLAPAFHFLWMTELQPFDLKHLTSFRCLLAKSFRLFAYFKCGKKNESKLYLSSYLEWILSNFYFFFWLLIVDTGKLKEKPSVSEKKISNLSFFFFHSIWYFEEGWFFGTFQTSKGWKKGLILY